MLCNKCLLPLFLRVSKIWRGFASWSPKKWNRKMKACWCCCSKAKIVFTKRLLSQQQNTNSSNWNFSEQKWSFDLTETWCLTFMAFRDVEVHAELLGDSGPGIGTTKARRHPSLNTLPFHKLCVSVAQRDSAANRGWRSNPKYRLTGEVRLVWTFIRTFLFCLVSVNAVRAHFYL